MPWTDLSRVAVKLNFRPYIRRYENFEYGYPHSDSLMQFELKLESCKPHKATRHQTKCDVINDVKLFPTVYRRIYPCKFLTLSNQSRARYKLIYIRNFKYAPGPKNYNASLKLRTTLVKYCFFKYKNLLRLKIFSVFCRLQWHL